MSARRAVTTAAAVVASVAIAGLAHAQAAGAASGPSIELKLGEAASGRASSILEMVALITLIGLAPSVLVLFTSFTRILVSLSILRQALGLPQVPPNQVLIGLSLFLSVFVMRPVWQQIDEQAVTPYVHEQIDAREGLKRAVVPLRGFMLAQTRDSDLALFVELSRQPMPTHRDEVAFEALAPAFLLSELKTSFLIGFLLYVPFLVLDLVVGSVLLAMGMMVLPPVVISLPFKLLLFVMVDGWSLVVGSLVRGFHT
ncbi:MAG: flagellar type III secretion system pore protein FliP [Deltaproteobacteria bacterium]|nr:flagellar type III secretion system pore protein FliP [Deltaproteobacteria bacterium]